MKTDENGCSVYWKKRKRDIRLLSSYTKKTQRNSVFSANITGNPHYFDEGRPGEKLLFHYLSERNFDLKQEGLSRVEYKNRIYYESGILKDEVSNDALAYGIHGLWTGTTGVCC